MRINFIINPFAPKPFFDQATVHGDDNIYLLIVPVIIDADATAFPNLVKYINSVPADGYQYTYLGSDNVLAAAVEAGTTVAATPAPFPEGTSLNLNIGTSVFSNADIGYVFRDNVERINWIYKNGSFAELDPAKYFASLTPAQVLTLETFVSGLLFRLLNGRHANGDLANGAPLPKEAQIIQLDNWLKAPLTKAAVLAYFQNTKDIPVTFDQMNLLCSQYLAYAATLGLNINNDQDKGMVAPLIKFNQQALLNLQSGAGGDQHINDLLGTDMHYLAILWNQFKTAYAGFQAAHKPTDPYTAGASLANQIRLFYGGGERLRVPAFPAGKENFFMQVFDDVNPQGTDSGWLISNGYSLPGHVIAVPRTVFATPGWETNFSLTINGTAAFALANPETNPDNQNFIAMFNTIATDWMVNYKRSDFTQAFTLLTDDGSQRNTGKARYYPASSLLGNKTDPAIPVSKPDNSGTIALLNVPRHLLDELEPAAAVAATSAKFLYFPLQRSWITTAELFKNGQFAPGNTTAAANPGVTPIAIIKAQLKQVILPLAPGTAAPKQIYKISCGTSGIHPDDLTGLNVIFAQASMGTLDAALVYQAPDPAHPGSKLNRYIPLDNSSFVLTAPGSTDLFRIFTKQDLQAIFPPPIDAAKSDKGEKTVSVDLMVRNPKIADLPAPGGGNFLFNKLTQPSDQSNVFLALENFFKFKFNLSVNSFSSLLQLDLKLPATLAADNSKPKHILKGHFSNFKKFRADLVNSDGSVSLSVNNADAFLPYADIPDTAGNITGHLYELTHAFNNESNSDPDAGENNRYLLYKHGGEQYSIKGYLEDEFAYRMTETPPLTVPLGYSQQITNLAAVVARPEKPAGITDQIPDVNPLLNFTVGKDFKIQISLDANCIITMLKTDSGNRTFRRLYEAFYDTVNNSCSFLVECWQFDNSVGIVPAGLAAHPELSGKMANIINQMVLTDSFQDSTDISTLVAWATAAPDFLTFKGMVSAPPNISPVTLIVPAAKIASITGADVIRVSLRINRVSDKTVAKLFPPAAAGQPPVIQDSDLLPLDYTDDQGNELPNSDFENLPKARRYLTDYIYPPNNPANQLFTSAAYIYSSQYSALRTVNDGSNYIKELLGEMASFAYVPAPGYFAGKPVTNTQLYYVPYAFLPLMPLPQMGSQQATTDLTEYLVTILSWLSYPESFSGNINDFIIFDTSGLSEQGLLSLKNQARQLLQSGLAVKMAGLIDHVDNRAAAAIPVPPELAEVVLLTDDAAHNTLPAIVSAFTSLLIDNPLLFITAKGFGVGLFSAEGAIPAIQPKMNDLYLLQLIKDIRDSSQLLTDPAKNYDVSLFNFHNFLQNDTHRFFVEVLDDELYDDEFKISESISDSPVIVPGDAAAPQIATQGRTAEDVLQNQTPFNATVPQRTAQIFTKHYNPDWNVGLQAGGNVQYYLLPSRKAPVTPVSVKNVNFLATASNVVQEPLTIFKSFVPDDQEWQLILNTNKTLLVALDKNAPASFTFDGNTYYNDQLFTTGNPLPTDDTWRRIDAYVNNYFFIVEGDEELSLNNDMIEVLVSATTPGQQAMESSGSPGGLFPSGSISDAYLANFDFYAHKNSAPHPPTVTIAGAVDITNNIDFLRDAVNALLVPSGGDLPDQADSQSSMFNPGGKNILYAPSGIAPLGGVLFTQVFPQDIPTTPATATGRKFLIRVAVLTDAWSYFKCRMRIKRNWRHVDRSSDLKNLPKNDINPKFTMTSAFSSWIDYGIQTFNVDYVESQQIGDMFSYFKYLKVDMLSIDAYINNPTQRNMPGLLTNTLKLAGTTRLLLANLFDQATWPFEALVYERKGNNLLAQYTPTKPAEEIIDINTAYAEISALVILSRQAVISNPAAFGLDLIVNPLSPNIKGYAPFIKITWFSKLDNNIPVFSINWQLKFSNF